MPIWLEMQPPWFDDNIMAKIPDWAMEDKDLLASIRYEEVRSLISERVSVLSNTRMDGNWMNLTALKA